LRFAKITGVREGPESPHGGSRRELGEAGGATSLFVLVLAVAALSGCGSDERALKLPAVKQALHAAGLGKLHILTQQGGYDELRRKRLFPEFTSGAAPNGPDYLQDQVRPELIVVRFGKVSEAAKVVPKNRTEHSGSLSAEANRACNVVVLNQARNVPRSDRWPRTYLVSYASAVRDWPRVTTPITASLAPAFGNVTRAVSSVKT
jgi:hypothetical protein